MTNVDYVRTHLGTDPLKALIAENSYHLIFFDNDSDFAVSKTIQFINTQATYWARMALTEP